MTSGVVDCAGSGRARKLFAGIPLILLGYVRFVAVVYSLFGRSYLIICAVQSVLGGAACVFVYLMARRMFNVAVGVLASILVALNFQLVFSAAAIGHQGLDVFLTTLCAWLLVVYLGGRLASPWLAGM